MEMGKPLTSAEKRVQFLALALFLFVFSMLMLSAFFAGVQEFQKLVFYGMVLTLGIVIILITIDRFDIPVFNIDKPTIIATIIGSIAIFGLVAIPEVGSFLVSQLGFVQASAADINDIITTLLFVAAGESIIKYVIIVAVKEAGYNQNIGIFGAAIGFALLHTFRYGFGPAFIYVFMIGIVLLLFGLLPKMLGSKEEYSIWPLIFPHWIHNIAIPAASVLFIAS